jgi:TolB protein
MKSARCLVVCTFWLACSGTMAVAENSLVFVGQALRPEGQPATAVFNIDADGSNPRNISWRGLTTEMAPSWSPDGQELAFISNRYGRFDVFVMDRS